MDILDYAIIGYRFTDADGTEWIALKPLKDGLYMAVRADAELPAPVLVVLDAAHKDVGADVA